MEIPWFLAALAILPISAAYPIDGPQPAFHGPASFRPTPTPTYVPVVVVPATSTAPFAPPARRDEAVEPCTYTLGITYSRLPTPPYWPWCIFDGTRTVYAATRTAYREYDCHGCLDVEVKTYPENIQCPPRTTVATTTVQATTTLYQEACSPTTTFPAKLVRERQDGSGDASAALAAGVEACPTTLVISGDDDSATSTVYERYVTVTQGLNCGGCPLVTASRVAGWGPVNRPGITATMPIGTTTSFICTA